MAFTTDSGVSLSQTIGHLRTRMRQGLAAARRTPALVLLAVAIVAYNALMGLMAEPVPRRHLRSRQPGVPRFGGVGSHPQPGAGPG